MQISSHVYLLARYYLGCLFSHPNDCNGDVLRCGTRYFPIGTGLSMDNN
jgi:hypothetical protein